MKRIKEKYLALAPDARRAFWLILAVAAGMLGFGIYLTPVLLWSSWWAMFVTNVMPYVIGIVSLISAGLILSGRPSLGGTIFLSGFVGGLFVLTVALEGLGYLLAALVFIVSGYIANLVWPRRVFTWAPILSMVAAAAILLTDAYAPWKRDWISSQDIRLAAIFAGIIIALYIAFVANQYRTFPLGTKLVLVSLGLTILPMALVGLMSYQASRAALEKNANESLVSSAAQVAEILDLFVRSNLDTVRSQSQIRDFAEYLELSPSERLGSEAEEHVMQFLAAFQQRDPVYITSYALLDSQGIKIADTNTENVGQGDADRDYFVEPVRTGLPYASRIRASDPSLMRSIYFSAPVHDAVGDIIGVLLVQYNANVLQQQVVRSGYLLPISSTSLLVDENNILLANSSESGMIYKSIIPLTREQFTELKVNNILPDLPINQLFVNLPLLAQGLITADIQPNFVGQFHSQEIDRSINPEANFDQAGTARMNSQAWHVVVTQPQDLLFAPSENLARGLLVLAILVAFAGIVFAILISQYLTNPVSRLTEAANRIAAGDLSARADVSTTDEIGTLAAAFNLMSTQLSGLVGTLEQRVADRTKALETSSEVSRHLSTILDADQLVKTVVEQLHQAFNYYHVHIYLYDPSGENLVMAGGSGEAGQIMLARGHRIPKGKGLVGRAAETGRPVLVSDVSQAPGWLPNPLLPETKSELAVPIAVGESVLGVLDVQQDQTNGLAQADSDLLQSIASQVAIGLQNARNYTQARSRANREAMMAAIGQRIQHTTSTEEALRVAVREVGRALNIDNVSVKIGSPENGRKEN